MWMHYLANYVYNYNTHVCIMCTCNMTHVHTFMYITTCELDPLIAIAQITVYINC